MKPSQLAKNLRAIAAYIEKTPRPSRTKVASALKSVVAGLKVKTAMKEPGQYRFIEEVWADALPSFAKSGNSEIIDLINADQFESAVTEAFRSYSDYAAKFMAKNPVNGTPTDEQRLCGPVAAKPLTLVNFDMDDREMGFIEVSGGTLQGTTKIEFDVHQSFSSWWMESDVSSVFWS